jgi:hypothetical protein
MSVEEKCYRWEKVSTLYLLYYWIYENNVRGNEVVDG